MVSFQEFWPRYLRAHRHRGTRIGHYCATTIALSAVAASITLKAAWLLVLAVVAGYSIALASHRLGDASRSLVLVNPVWGAVADLKMCWLALTGKLAAEMAYHLGGTAEQDREPSPRPQPPGGIPPLVPTSRE